jgi:hypothetical protein
MRNSSVYSSVQQLVARLAAVCFALSSLYLVWSVSQANRMMLAMWVAFPVAILLAVLVAGAVRDGGVYRRPRPHGIHLWSLCAFGVLGNLFLVAFVGLV